MTKSKAAPGFRPAARVLALIMGVSLLVLGAAGLAWHLTDREHWLLGENIGLDVFHLVMGLLALGAGGTRRSAKGYGGLAFVVFLVAAGLAGASPMLAHSEHVTAGVPTWLAENTIGFSEINYILYFLMALWGLQLATTKPDVDPWGSGDAHSALRALPDREDAIAATQKALTQSAATD